MTKINTGALQNIEFQDIKSYLKENKHISGLTDFIRDYIQYILRSENQNTLKKVDFDFMQGYINDIYTHKQKDSLSLLMIEKEIHFMEYYSSSGWDNYRSIIQRFYKVEDIEKIRNLILKFGDDLMFSRTENLKYTIDFCKTPEQFEKLCANKNIIEVMRDYNTESLIYFIALFNFTSFDSFEEAFTQHGKDFTFPHQYQLENIRHITRFFKRPKDFEKLCANKNIIEVMRYTKPEILKYVINLYQVQTLEEFERVCTIGDVAISMIDMRPENLKYIIDFYQVQTAEQFEKLCKNERIIDAMGFSQEYFRYLISLCKNSGSIGEIM